MAVKMFEKALGRLELKAYEDICICGDAILKDCKTCKKTLDFGAPSLLLLHSAPLWWEF